MSRVVKTFKVFKKTNLLEVFHWKRKVQIWLPCWKNFSNDQIFSAHCPKTMRNVFLNKKCFSSKGFCWFVDCSFDNPAKQILPKVWFCFGYGPKKKDIFWRKNPTMFFFQKNTLLQNSTVELKKAILKTLPEIYCQNVENCENDETSFFELLLPSKVYSTFRLRFW